jgi:hypothetical protein
MTEAKAKKLATVSGKISILLLEKPSATELKMNCESGIR